MVELLFAELFTSYCCRRVSECVRSRRWRM